MKKKQTGKEMVATAKAMLRQNATTRPNFATGMCANCGADSGLHHYETAQCPQGGIEEWREGRKQVWMDTRFEDSGVKRLHDSAPELYEALQPFSKLAQEVLNNTNLAKHQDVYAYNKAKITMDDLRVVLKVLEKIKVR